MLAVLFTEAHHTVAAQPVLVPGPLIVDCRSALRVGIASCGEPTAGSDRAQSVTEAQVTEYLAEYGKPPREAVRALLDPSDKNIAAWIRKQRQVTSIATYVATRMTELQSQLDTETLNTTVIPVSQFPAMIQMRATLFLGAENVSSQRVARALQQVVSRYPSIDGRIVQIESQGEKQRLNWLLNLDTLLPVSIATPEKINNLPLPSLLIEDLRYRTRLRVDATDITAQQICDEILALRIGAQPRAQPLPSAQLSP